MKLSSRQHLPVTLAAALCATSTLGCDDSQSKLDVNADLGSEAESAWSEQREVVKEVRDLLVDAHATPSAQFPREEGQLVWLKSILPDTSPKGSVNVLEYKPSPKTVQVLSYFWPGQVQSYLWGFADTPRREGYVFLRGDEGVRGISCSYDDKPDNGLHFYHETNASSGDHPPVLFYSDGSALSENRRGDLASQFTITEVSEDIALRKCLPVLLRQRAHLVKLLQEAKGSGSETK